MVVGDQCRRSDKSKEYGRRLGVVAAHCLPGNFREPLIVIDGTRWIPGAIQLLMSQIAIVQFRPHGLIGVRFTCALVPKLQFGNAALEALLRHPAFNPARKRKGSGASRVCVPKLELGNEGNEEIAIE